jgi:adenylate cyclase
MGLKKYLNTKILVSFFSFLLVGLFFVFGLLNHFQEKIYDLYFLQKSPPKDILIISIDNDSIKDLNGWPLRREYFAKVLENLTLSKAVGFDVAFVDQSIYGQTDDFIFQQKINQSERGGLKIVVPFQYDDRGLKKIEPIIKSNTTGFVNILVDSDGVVRRFLPTKEGSNSFVVALANEITEKSNFKKEIRVNYFGKEKTFPNIPFIDVYKDKLPKIFFKDKIILIGASSRDLHDFFNTPFGIVSGVEIQANALGTIISNQFFVDLPIAFSLLLILMFSIIPLYIVDRYKNILKLLFSLFLIFLFINLSTLVLFEENILLPVLYLNIVFILSSVLLITVRYFEESKDKKFIKDMFQYYLTPDVINLLIQNPDKLTLGGERKRMTVFFSDIRGFTTISEKLSPEGLTELLNEYLTEMTDIIMANRGVVDKYIGDAVMAFWGAPVKNDNQIIDACRSMILMSKKLKELNKKWKEKDKDFPQINAGMGLNFGDMLVGNMGSRNRFNYTVMGDEVNFASRLEGLNKAYGSECLISESVYLQIKDNKEFKTRFIDEVLVKGKKESKKIYELLTDSSSGTNDFIKEFETAKGFYKIGEFKKAGDLFSVLYHKYNDIASKVFYDRCLDLEQKRPETWNGIYEFKEK